MKLSVHNTSLKFHSWVPCLELWWEKDKKLKSSFGLTLKWVLNILSHLLQVVVLIWKGKLWVLLKYCSSRSSVCLRKVPGLLFSFACWLVQLGFLVELGPAHFTRCLGKGRPHCRSVNSWSVQSWGRSMPLHWVVVVVVGIAEYSRIQPYCYRRHLGHLLWLTRLQTEGDKLPHGHKITPRNMYRLHCKHSRQVCRSREMEERVAEPLSTSYTDCIHIIIIFKKIMSIITP